MSDKVEIVASPPSVDAKPVKKASIGMQKDYVHIILEESENMPPTGLPIGVNGKGYILRAGEPAWVPPAVIEVLDNAIQAMPRKDSNTLKVIGTRSRRRFPYRLVTAADLRLAE